MTITLTQPHNKDGKPTPMCAFDPVQRFYGHAFANLTLPGAEQQVDTVRVKNAPLVVCTRCGVLWEAHV